MLPGYIAASGLALACAGGGFEGSYNLRSAAFIGSNNAMLAPGNDSRVNLMFLLADSKGLSTAGLAYPDASHDFNQTGPVFLDWRMLRAAFTRAPAVDYAVDTPPYAGTRCAGYAAGTAAFSAALAANGGLPAAERTALAASRAAGEAVCKDATAWERRYGDRKGTPIAATGQWPAVTSAAGREFLAYLRAADAFYAERFADALAGFAGLSRAADPWVRETAAYMIVRAQFAAAQQPAFGDYGEYQAGKVDQAAVQRGRVGIDAYLGAWPRGRYAASLAGLQRRAAWLAGDQAALASIYGAQLGQVPAAPEAAVALVEEIDSKLPYATGPAETGRNVLLLAMNDLFAMRVQDGEGAPRPGITAEDLAAQAPLFAGQPDLFGYLQATHAFYFARDYRRVLALIPDDARRPAYSNLGFSRQVLRGMALAALRDRNEAGFWMELIGGAKGLWQRPLVELALAMNLERSGRLDAVFAPGSAVTEPTLRTILIDHSASPALLRRIAAQKALPAGERDHALMVLLSNELTRGQFAAFLNDAAIPVVARDAAAAIFTRGPTGDGSYACPVLADTVRTLAARPADPAALLCLGEFFRLNGQGQGGYSPPAPQADELGGFAKGFDGRRLGRAEFYDKVMASPAASADDKAYALYRAVMCYAPSGSSECGPDVPKSRRKAWFDQLRKAYPDSRWTKKLRYYW